MRRLISRCVAAPWSLIALLSLATAVSSVGAQEKTTVVSFASGSASRNGYVHGQLTLRYRFDSCGDAPILFYAVVPGSVRGYEGYWYEGKMYGLKTSWRPSDRPALDAEMRVRFSARPISVSPLKDPYPGEISCFSGSQMRNLGKWSDYTSPSMTREQALTRFDFDVGITREPMRSSDVEAAIRAEIASAKQQAQKDSLEKLRLARIEQARKDSIARAQQAKPTTTKATSSTGTAATSGTGMVPTTGSATQGNAGTQNAAQTEAERRAEEQREADARARAVIAQLEAEQAAREERSRQVDAAAQEIAGMVGSVLAERAAQKEREREREYAAYERHRNYADRVARVYAALPARPMCTAGDTVSSVTDGGEVHGTMIGSECRLTDSSSAHIYPLRIARKQKVEINASGAFETRVTVLNSQRAVVLSSPDTGIYVASQVEGFLTPGDYSVVLHTRHPGESGTYTVKVERGELSRTAKWSLGMYLNTVSGEFAGTADESQFENMGGFRGMAAINKALHLQAAWGSADGTNSFQYWDVGARLYLGNRAQRFRPLFDVLYGGREMFADNGYTGTYYKGNGMTYAGGIEWFLTPVIGIELIYAQVNGTLDIVEAQSGYSPTIDFTHGALRFGMMFHR